MALSVVQSIIRGPIDNADSDSGTFGSTPAAGNLIVICVGGWNGAGFDMPTGGVTDNKGNSYGRAIQAALEPGGAGRCAIFYAYNIASSATFTPVVNPTGASGNYFTWSATEVAGAMTTDPLDKTASSTSSTTTATTGTTATLSQAAEIVFAVMNVANAHSFITVESVSPSWTELYEELDNNNHWPTEADQRIVAATTAQSCSWTIGAGANGTSSACLATFMEAGAGGGTPQLYQARFNTLLRL